tara:strand:- start:5373 stop:6506 length:1134 start_codon:yes stop_codon:yes gene_type:complete
MFVGHYLPGTKSGGILRSVENMVNQLSANFDFYIVTRNRDVDSIKTYTNIPFNQWIKVRNANVYYLDDNSSSFINIIKLIKKTQYNYLFINSFFDSLSVKVIFAKKLQKLPQKPIILSPRGEFAWASFKIRLFKKIIYLIFSRIFRLYNGITWHVSSHFEEYDLIKMMNIKKEGIKIAMDLPKLDLNRDFSNEHENLIDKKLKIIFLSRISEEKNLDVAIKILSKVKSNVIFDIYGSVDSKSYWNRCQEMLSTLPNCIEYNYYGFVKNEDVLNIFSQYDLFLFPTGGENYGHVIAESISVGTKVLISKNTPWIQLQKDNIGWDISLDKEDNFVKIIEELSSTNLTDRLKHRRIARSSFIRRFNESNSLAENINLFNI